MNIVYLRPKKNLSKFRFDQGCIEDNVITFS